MYQIANTIVPILDDYFALYTNRKYIGKNGDVFLFREML